MIDRDKINKEYDKILLLVESNQFEIARNLLNLLVEGSYTYPQCRPLYAELSIQQLINLVVVGRFNPNTSDSKSYVSRNKIFLINFNLNDSKVKLSLNGINDDISIELQRKKSLMRPRGCLLDACLFKIDE